MKSIEAPAGAPAQAHRLTGRQRSGYTLVELMVVTAIMSLLALLAVGPLMKARERAMLTAARIELSNMVRAAEMYRALNGRLPHELALLEQVDHEGGKDIVVCRFELTTGPSPAQDQLRMDVRHAAMQRGLTTIHPSSNGATTELNLGACAGEAGGGAGGDGQGGGPGRGGGVGGGVGGGRDNNPGRGGGNR